MTPEKKQRVQAVSTLIRLGWSPPAPNTEQANRIIDDILRLGSDDQIGGSLALTDKELVVLSLLAEGHTRDGVAERMNYSTDSVKAFVTSILRKLGARNTAHAVAIAYRAGELELRRAA